MLVFPSSKNTACVGPKDSRLLLADLGGFTPSEAMFISLGTAAAIMANATLFCGQRCGVRRKRQPDDRLY